MSYWEPAGKVDIPHVLEVLEVENLRREGMREMRFSCPFPGHENGDQSASAYANVEEAVWYCHGCKRKGSIVNLTAALLDLSPMKARRLLRQAYDPSSLNPDERRIVEELHEFFAKRREAARTGPINLVIDDSFIDRFAVDWKAAWEACVGGDGFAATDYMFERGFTWETLNDWNFGYDERTQRITIPVRDENGGLIGFKGRAWDGRHPKYLNIGDSEGREPYYGHGRYYTGSVVFGLDRCAGMNTLIICEGELNAIALHQMGFVNAVALNGSNLTRAHIRLVRKRAESVIFMFDFDKAGLEGLWGRDDEETGEHKPGALELLTVDLSVRVAQPLGFDAADALTMGPGQHADVATAIKNAESYTVARLRRQLALAR